MAPPAFFFPVARSDNIKKRNSEHRREFYFPLRKQSTDAVFTVPPTEGIIACAPPRCEQPPENGDTNQWADPNSE